jgi:hypothetical protein
MKLIFLNISVACYFTAMAQDTYLNKNGIGNIQVSIDINSIKMLTPLSSHPDKKSFSSDDSLYDYYYVNDSLLIVPGLYSFSDESPP